MRPQEPTGLNKFDGLPAAGTWTLRITDIEPNDSGVLNEWGPTGARAQFPCSRPRDPGGRDRRGERRHARAARPLAGTVDPNGRATGLRFAYGKTAAYGSATATQDAGAGSGRRSRARPTLTGLDAGTTYHYRVEAIREGGAVAVGGADGTFTTAPPPGRRGRR